MEDKSFEDIKLEVKKKIIQTLNIKNVNPEDILDDVSFFSGENNIKIDSVDSLELVLAIQKEFKVRINNQNLAWTIINTVNSISEFIYNEHHKVSP
jgi:acyl carrier protein